MAVWKILLFPVLIMGAGFVWIFAVGMMGMFVPEINAFILNNALSQQTVDSIDFSLQFLQMMPGVVLVMFGIGLVIDEIRHGGGDEY